ncbi:MAG: hypothetical protein Q8J78_03630 [Moraxellaceae bacterium]|nr:hypothetical protein [Moraxellaceae bacterium]
MQRPIYRAQRIDHDGAVNLLLPAERQYETWLAVAVVEAWEGRGPHDGTESPC